MREFPFYGGLLVVSDQRERYNELKKKYRKSAISIANRFVEVCKTQMITLDDFIEEGYTLGREILSKTIKEASSDLFNMNLIEATEENFNSKYYVKYDIWPDCYQNILWNVFYALVPQEISKLEAITPNIDTRLRDTNRVKSLFNTYTDDLKQLKKELFKGPDMQKWVYDEMFKAAITTYKPVAEAVNLRIEAGYYQVVSEQDVETANRLLEQATTKEDYAKLIEINPYDEKMYQKLIDNLYDENKDIESIGAFFGFELHKYKLSKLKNSFKKLESEELPVVKKAYDDFKELTAKLAINEVFVKDELEFLQSKVQEKQKIARTVAGIEYATDEEAEAARVQNKQYEHLLAIIKGEDEDLINQALSTIMEKDDTEINRAYIVKLKNRLVELDGQARTVDGVTFETREEAATAREELVTLNEIAGIVEHNSERQQLFALKDRIIKTCTTNIRLKYLDMIEQKLTAYDLVEMFLTKYEGTLPEGRKERVAILERANTLIQRVTATGINGANIISFAENLDLELRTVFGTICVSIEDAEQKYRDMVLKARDYEEAKEKKSSIKYMFSGLKKDPIHLRALGYEEEWNRVTDYGKKPIPTI